MRAAAHRATGVPTLVRLLGPGGECPGCGRLLEGRWPTGALGRGRQRDDTDRRRPLAVGGRILLSRRRRGSRRMPSTAFSLPQRACRASRRTGLRSALLRRGPGSARRSRVLGRGCGGRLDCGQRCPGGPHGLAGQRGHPGHQPRRAVAPRSPCGRRARGTRRPPSSRSTTTSRRTSSALEPRSQRTPRRTGRTPSRSRSPTWVPSHRKPGSSRSRSAPALARLPSTPGAPARAPAGQPPCRGRAHRPRDRLPHGPLPACRDLRAGDTLLLAWRLTRRDSGSSRGGGASQRRP